jgi:hypothetical protein
MFFDELTKCSNVYFLVPEIEKAMCVNGMEQSFSIITLYSWLALIILLSAIGLNKLKPIADKRKAEDNLMELNETMNQK